MSERVMKKKVVVVRMKRMAEDFEDDDDEEEEYDEDSDEEDDDDVRAVRADPPCVQTPAALSQREQSRGHCVFSEMRDCKADVCSFFTFSPYFVY